MPIVRFLQQNPTTSSNMARLGQGCSDMSAILCKLTISGKRVMGMNRDEKLTRAKGRPPSQRKIEDHRVIYLSEPRAELG